MIVDSGDSPYTEWEPTVHLRWSIMGELEQRYERDKLKERVDNEGVYDVEVTEMEWRPIEKRTLR